MTTPARPRTRADLTVVEVDGEAIVYDAETRQLHRLNPSGRIVFSLCDGSATIRELAGDIAEAYGLPLQDVETHVDNLVGDLRTAGLLENDHVVATAGTAAVLERPVPPAVELPARHLHTKRRGNP